MLYHLIPKFYDEEDNHVAVHQIAVPELNFILNGQQEISARRPYPNKSYLVVCRKKGKKAINGLLLELPDEFRDFTLVTTWKVNVVYSVTHTVRYRVTGNQGDVVTEDMSLWHKTSGHPSLWPAEYSNYSPLQIKPCMEFKPSLPRTLQPKDVFGPSGIQHRVEALSLPVMELERFNERDSVYGRLPALSDAFTCGVATAS